MATAYEVMRTAASQIGTLEDPRGSNRVPYWSLKPTWNGNPWCATFVQWCLKQNGMWYDASLPYYVPSFAAKAKADGTWLSKTVTPRPGDFVVYGTTGYSHIGFLEKANLDGTIQTIEGNTSAGTSGSQSNGDGVYRRRRSRSWVRGFIRPAYVKTSLGGGMTAPINTTPAPAPKPTTAPKPAALTVDGELGPNTIKRWQQVMGTPADGVISRPSTLVKAVQRHLNTKGARLVVDGKGIGRNNDGDYGPTKTVKALQRYLGTTADGVLSSPSSKAVAALQRRLNTGKF